MTESERSEARNRLARRLLHADQTEKRCEALEAEHARLLSSLNKAYDHNSNIRKQNAHLKRQLEAAEESIASVRVNADARALRGRNRELTAELLRTQKLWNQERQRANDLELQQAA